MFWVLVSAMAFGIVVWEATGAFVSWRRSRPGAWPNLRPSAIPPPPKAGPFRDPSVPVEPKRGPSPELVAAMAIFARSGVPACDLVETLEVLHRETTLDTPTTCVRWDDPASPCPVCGRDARR